MRYRTPLLSAVAIALALAVPRPAPAQEARAPALFDTSGGAWAYVSYYRVPWSRVDSLIKLNRFRPAQRARGQQLGCFLDNNLLIHQTGNEYNVVITTTYASYRDFGPGSAGPACNARAFREVVPDSTLRAAIQQGTNWVFFDGPHYDVIYWVPYPARR